MNALNAQMQIDPGLARPQTHDFAFFLFFFWVL